MKKEISEVVGNSVVNTVNTMFGDNLVHKKNAPGDSELKKSVVVTVKLEHPADLSIDLCFNFETSLLTALAAGIYPKDIPASNAIFEDLASEIANIVTNKTRAFLMDQGHDLAMNFPHVEHGEQHHKKDAINLYFSSDKIRLKDDLGAIVNYQLKNH